MENKKPPVVEDLGPTFGTKEAHESYGTIRINKIHGDQVLFGSSIDHYEVIKLTVSPAVKYRTLNHDRYSDNGQPLIEVLLSKAQLADMILSPNIGNGVPCTLYTVNGKKMDGCPRVNKRQEIVDEFNNAVMDTTKNCNQLKKAANEILNSKGAIKKADKEQLQDLIFKMIKNVQDSLPFIQSQFNEQCERTTDEMKSEVQSYLDSTVRSLGIQGLEELAQKRLTNDTL